MIQAKPYLREIVLQRDRIGDDTVYPFNIPAIKHLEALSFHPDVTFLVGENGSGKSTLLEAIALNLGFSEEGGTRNMNFHNADTVSELNEYLKLVRSFARPRDSYFLRAESLYNVSTYADEVGAAGAAYGFQSMHARSHGELFFDTLNNKFRGKGLYLLDEPEAALSPQRQLAALAAIHDLVERESQFIIATHSPILMAYPRATILHLNENGIHPVEFTDTEHYAVTKAFLNNHSGLLDELLKPQLDLPLD